MAAMVGVCAALAALLTVPSMASAIYEPVSGGATRLTLSGPFGAILSQNHVKLKGTGGVTIRGAVVTFPVSGGKFDPTDSRGAVDHDGALVLSSGGRSIPMRGLMLKTTRKTSPFSAKLGGSQLKLSVGARVTMVPAGFGEKVTTTALRLSGKVATRLGKKLRLPDIFAQGQLLGSAVSRVSPETLALTNTGSVAFTFSPDILAKLKALFVAVNPIFPAERPDTTFTLPIAGGTISPDASIGTVETKGSLELLQLGAGQVFWHEGWIDLAAPSLSAELEVQPSPPFAGKAGRLSIASLSLTGATVTPDPALRTVTVQNASLALQPGLAQTFNETFARPQGKDNVFLAGEPLGTVSFTAQGQ